MPFDIFSDAEGYPIFLPTSSLHVFGTTNKATVWCTLILQLLFEENRIVAEVCGGRSKIEQGDLVKDRPKGSP